MAQYLCAVGDFLHSPSATTNTMWWSARPTLYSFFQALCLLPGASRMFGQIRGPVHEGEGSGGANPQSTARWNLLWPSHAGIRSSSGMHSAGIGGIGLRLDAPAKIRAAVRQTYPHLAENQLVGILGALLEDDTDLRQSMEVLLVPSGEIEALCHHDVSSAFPPGEVRDQLDPVPILSLFNPTLQQLTPEPWPKLIWEGWMPGGNFSRC